MLVRDTIYINGAWVPSTGKGTLEVIDSATEEVFATIPEGTPEDVDKAVEAAAAAFPGWAATSASIMLVLAFTVGYFVLVDRAVTGFRALQPRYCSIYQAPFWRHERFWKVPSNAYQHIFDGTPFKGVLWRLLGVRIGRRVFDDGCAIVERTLVSVGDDCTLGTGSIVQSHSLEDGTFKSDHITIGTGCTIGTGTFLLYGTTMGDGSVLDTDSFLLKGEHVPPRALWRGNPATEVPAAAAPIDRAPSDRTEVRRLAA